MKTPQLDEAQAYWLLLERERYAVNFQTMSKRERLFFDAGRYSAGAKDTNARKAHQLLEGDKKWV